MRIPITMSPVVPYTLLRPCANASAASFYPECVRWSGSPPEKNAGLARYADGQPLPRLAAYREQRDAHHGAARGVERRAHLWKHNDPAVRWHSESLGPRTRTMQSPRDPTTGAARERGGRGAVGEQQRARHRGADPVLLAEARERRRPRAAAARRVRPALGERHLLSNHDDRRIMRIKTPCIRTRDYRGLRTFTHRSSI